MAKPLKAPMPETLDLPPGTTIEFDAVNPTTGATVANVVVEDANLTALNLLTGANVNIDFGPFMLVPGPEA